MLRMLNCITKFVQKLDEASVLYCHWKSNQHLQDSLLGLTDLDILVDRQDVVNLQNVLHKSGFRRFTTPAYCSYPAIEDYLGYDTQTGKLVHLHLHYQLTLGEKHLKGYCLPWEKIVLATRRLNYDKIYIIDPCLEFLLLLLRLALKIRFRDYIYTCFGKPYLQDSTLKEFHWLQKRVSSEEVTAICKNLLAPKTIGLVKTLLKAPPSLYQLHRLRKTASAQLRLYRTYSPLQARWHRTRREFLWLKDAALKKYFHKPGNMGRTLPQGGVLIGIIGADGSGKSTLTQELNKWLSWKLNVYPVYFGSGGGSSSFLRWPLKLVYSILRTIKASSTHPDSSLGTQETIGYPQRCFDWIKNLGKALWALTLAFEKRKKLSSAWKAKNQGKVVICDRYPQNQVMGFNDGPLLSNWIKHRFQWLQILARWEQTPYHQAQIMPPDLVIKLVVSLQVAQQRRPDMSLKNIRRRVNVVQNLVFPSTTKIENINADESLDEVILKIKHIIWSNL